MRMFFLAFLTLLGMNNPCTASKLDSSSPSIVSRNFVAEITPEANTPFGIWGDAEFCPDGSFARDFELKIEPYLGLTGGDDTSMNAIKLWCYYNVDGNEYEAGVET